MGRTLYLDGELVGLVDTLALAAQIVEAMNRSPEKSVFDRELEYHKGSACPCAGHLAEASCRCPCHGRV